MKILTACALVLAPFVSVRGDDTPKPPEGFTALFNGKDLSGWHGRGTEDPVKWTKMKPEQREAKMEASRADIRKHWSVKDGVLVNDGQGAYLTTDKEYGDFELRLEYKTVADADSGIYLRGIPQVQIWDPNSKNKKLHKLGILKGSGGLWNNPGGTPGKDPLVKADKPMGEWNSFRIIMQGEIVTVWLNYMLVVDKAKMYNYFDKKGPVPDTGPIQLQTHGGEISWRNIYIKELEKGEKAPKKAPEKKK
jgi:hypothetical protein